jgi:prephenate dehydrogenase
MRPFKKVTIIGVGLIGGSIALAVKKKKMACQVIGVFRRKSTLRRALKRKAVDKGTLSIAEGVRGADLVILATPVRTIPQVAKDVFRFAKKGAIVTDAGSTKGWLVCKMEGMSKHAGSRATFIGSHPMAGSEHAGVEFARSDLLEGAPCIVTKTRATDRTALRKIVKFWKRLGSDVKVLTPDHHDASVSFISHLPHIAAFALAGAIPSKDLQYAAEGFKDTTRVASSDPRLWADIFLTNRKKIAAACRVFEKYYRSIVNAVVNGDYEKTARLLGAAKAKRDKFFYGKK